MSGNELLTPGPEVASELTSPAPGNAMQMPPGGVMQQVRGSYSTAVQVQQPRNINRVQSAILEEARLAGETIFYGWGAGKDSIEGGSIGLAMIMARCWGSCAVETLPVQETPDAWIFTAAFIDLESGFTVSRQFRQSKRSTVHGKHDAERKDDMRFAIGQSKAARNVILKALPEWLRDQAIAQAKVGVRKKIVEYIKKDGMPAAIEILLVALKKEGISEEQVLAKFEIASTSGLDVDQLVILRGDLRAIQDGQETARNLFPDLEGDALAAQLHAKAAKTRKTAEAPEQPTTTTEEPPAEKGPVFDEQKQRKIRSDFEEQLQLVDTKAEVEEFQVNAENARNDGTISGVTLHKCLGYCAERLAELKKKSGK